jgi:O-antigen/teichoic acid export membrane protein
MIFRNSLATSGAMITGYLFSFVLAPIMLARLGLDLFGVWAVTGAIATYAAIMDLGIRRAVERFVAFYDARDDRRSIEELFGLGLLIITVVTVLASAAAVVAAPFVAGLLGDALSPTDMRIVLLSAVAIMVLNAYQSVMRAIPIGLQQMVAPAIAQTAGNVINFVFSLAALALSRDLVVYALANAAAAALSVIPTAIAVKHVWSPVRVRVPSRPLVNEVLGFSLKAQVAWLGALVNNQTDKIILGVLVDVRAAGAYEIANRVVLAVKAISVMSISALTSASTAQITREGSHVIPEFYRRYTQRSLSVSLPLLVFTTVTAPVLLTAWLGDVPENTIAVVVVLTLANCVNMATGVASTVSLGDGRVGAIARLSVIIVIINIVLTLALTPFFGLWGVLAGSALAISLGAVGFLIYFHRLYRIPAAVLARATGVPAFAAGLAGVPAICWLVFIGFPYEGRLPSVAATAVSLLVYVAIYWPLASKLDILPDKLNMRRRSGRAQEVPATT